MSATDGGWEPDGWWRVTKGVGGGLWRETSSKSEALAAVDTCPGGGVLWRHFVRTEHKWEAVTP